MGYWNDQTKKFMREPGLEPGSHAWEACMLTSTLSALWLQFPQFGVYIGCKIQQGGPAGLMVQHLSRSHETAYSFS